MRDEFVGYLRHAEVMLAKAADAVKDDWEAGEVMLSPQRVAEFTAILKRIRSSTREVAEVGENFAKVAEMRRVTETKL